MGVREGHPLRRLQHGSVPGGLGAEEPARGPVRGKDNEDAWLRGRRYILKRISAKGSRSTFGWTAKTKNLGYAPWPVCNPRMPSPSPM